MATAASLAPGLGSAIAISPWMYPALEVVHIIGIGVLLGNLLLFELRAWGLFVALPAAALARAALPLAVCGFALAAASGLTMFATQPAELLSNRTFVLKMVLLMFAGSNALAFHLRGGSTRLDRVAKAQTALSLGLWFAIIICGRWIAYG